MRILLLLVAASLPFLASAQLLDNFSDGNFTANPGWSGNAALFTVNAAQQLQSNGSAVTATGYLSTPSQVNIGAGWEFYANLKFATSSANYADIFLVSDSADLKGANKGYFVRIGDTPDEVSLWRKDGTASSKIIDGTDGTISGTANNIVKVKVTRSEANLWQLWIDLVGTGSNYVPQGTVTDATHQRSDFFGVLLKYSSANSLKFYFDDFKITDVSAPQISAATVISGTQLDLLFNEPVGLAASQNVANYSVSGGTGNPASAQRDGQNPALVHLNFSNAFSAGSHSVSVSTLSDLYGNTAPALSTNFTFSPPVATVLHDVRITELLADYSPAVGLPEAEFVELYNSSSKTFNLQGWKLADATNAPATLPAYNFAPGTYIILCARADTALFKPYGKTLGLPSFPSLNDAGDDIKLLDNAGKLIDKVGYVSAWYKDSKKQDGGWSLEMIDATNACAGSDNWMASVAANGGTPGLENSVKASRPDNMPPKLVSALAIGPSKIVLHFDEKLDSLAATQAVYQVLDGPPVLQVLVVGPDFISVELTLAQPLPENRVFGLEARNVRDCSGNLASVLNTDFVLPVPAQKGDLVINEILFNPKPGGVDFVELANRSSHYIDLKDWQLANLENDSVSNSKTVPIHYILAPGQLVAITTRPDMVMEQFSTHNPNAFLQLPSLPAFNDDAGTVVLLDPAGEVADSLTYAEEMHFELLDGKEGVSLERVRLGGPTNKSNFHWAASTAGYATPGRQNSQAQENLMADSGLAIEPKVFSPDGDGYKDFTTFNFHASRNGQVATITIYDSRGREIKKLARNELLAAGNFFQWDGLTNAGRKAPVGYYLVLVEVFDLQGRQQSFKKTVAIGARF